MKYFFTTILLAFGILLNAQTWTPIYNNQKIDGVWANKYLKFPTDTTANKTGVVMVANKFWIGNGTKWSTVSSDTGRGNSQLVTGGSLKKVIDSSKLYVNIANFGAIPNDGTNDATAIRNAINYAYNNGYSTVFFPPGVYTSTEDSIGIRSGLRYLGYGATIQQATSNTCIFLAYPNAVSNVTFEGLTLLGKGTDYNGTDVYSPFRPVGISIASSDTSKNVKIINCTIRNFAYSAITVAYGKDVWIENNKLVGYSGVAANDIKNFGVDINNGNRRVTVIGNHIDSVAQGILVQGNVWEYSLIGNIITNVIGQHGIYASSGWNSVIQGNTIKNTVANGILLQLTSGQLRGIENMVVNGNTIDSAGGYGIYAYRISGTDLLRNISITNNIIRGKLQTTGAGIELSYCEGGTVSGNYTNGYAYSLLMQSDKYINVSNHAGYNSNLSGLYIQADTTRHLTFNNVRFINPSRGGSNAWGISANGGSYLTFNNAFVSDSTATMTYSLYIQPNVDQATVRVTNSTFLNAAVRFESSKAIAEYGANIAASYYNSPASITSSRISVNGNSPDKSNAITVTSVSGSAGTSAAATSNNFSIIGSLPYLFLRNTNTATEDYYIQASINSSQSAYGNYLGLFLPTGKEFFVNKYITSSTGFKILGGTSAQYLMADGSVSSGTSGVSEGTYTPTITGVSNYSSATITNLKWVRAGNKVTVFGFVSAKATASGFCTFSITLPVSSALSGGDDDIGGAGTFQDVTASTYVPVMITSTSTQAKISFKTTTVSPTATSGSITFSYTVN